MNGASGEVIGTTGQSRRMEGIALSLQGFDLPAGSVEYMVHMQRAGWGQGWRSDGAFTGMRGKSRRIEAIRVRLTGALAERYDVWYRVHVQRLGWMGWTRNGAGAGTTGQSRRMEAYEIVILPKNSPAPGPTTRAFRGRL